MTLRRPRRKPKRSRPSQPSTHSGPASSVLIALALLAILSPTLARSPQNGDGAEILATALRGGVLHPPGFPLQAWLDRLLAPLPGVSPAVSISCLGLAAHSGAAFFVAETLRVLGVGIFGRLLGAGAFATFPSIWTVAVQPEVFSLAHLFIAAVVCFSVRLEHAPDGAPGTRSLIALGLCGSLGAAQHPIAVTALLPLAAGAFHALRSDRHRWSRAAGFGAALILPAAALYLSLPLLRTASHWPDWGSLDSWQDVMRHLLRADYGTFTMSAATGENGVTGLGAWIDAGLRGWNAALILGGLGVVAAVVRRPFRSALIPVGGLAITGLLLLWRARLPLQTYTAEVLERLQGPVTLAAAILMGIGYQTVRERIPRRSLRRGLDGIAIAALVAWLASGWPIADASTDRTLELHAGGLALELPEDAVYVAASDVEAFLGVPTSRGIRYPVSRPLSSLGWYARDIAPRIEPRVLGGGPLGPWHEFLGACLRRGYDIYSTDRALVATSAGVPELRGLWYVARPGSSEEFTRETVSSAIRLAPWAERLPVLPPHGRAFSRFYVRRFERAYAGAAVALARMGKTGLAARADSVRVSLARSDSRERTAARLREFVGSCREAGF